MKRWDVGDVYICEGVRDNASWEMRAGKLLEHFQAERVSWDARFSRSKQNPASTGEGRRPYGDRRPPMVVLSVLRFEGMTARIVAPADGFPLPLVEQPFDWSCRRDADCVLHEHGVICQSAVQFESICGCLHRCGYCEGTRLILIPVNPESVLAHLDGLLAENPDQTLFKHGASTDILCFEPEYGITRMLVEYFAGRPERYLMLFTKSDNVDFLLDLPHRGQTIICWSLSAATAAREIEVLAASTSERIRAARECQDAGYRVRFRFSPIIPTQGWERENEAMVNEIFDSGVHPDLITLRTVGWIEYEELKRVTTSDLIDPRLRKTMAQAASEGRIPQMRCRPLPEEARIEIYVRVAKAVRKANPGARIALCWETPDVWSALYEWTDMRPDHFVCNCGPRCAPPNPLLS